MLESTEHPIRFYGPRKPWETPLYRLLEKRFDEFEQVYPDRFQRKYGFWRPVVHRAVNDFLDCGDPREGFARVRCPECRHEFFVAFSCKQRCICPSCHQKRTLVTSINIAENISAPVPHRQFVFTMPKRFRLYFRYNRDLLGNSCPCGRSLPTSVMRFSIKANPPPGWSPPSGRTGNCPAIRADIVKRARVGLVQCASGFAAIDLPQNLCRRCASDTSSPADKFGPSSL